MNFSLLRYYLFFALVLNCWLPVVSAQPDNGSLPFPDGNSDEFHFRYPGHLKNRLVPVTHPVYKLLELYEASGLTGFLPQSRPYTREMIFTYLQELLAVDQLNDKETKVIQLNLSDLLSPAAGPVIKKQEGKSTFALVGAAAQINGRSGFGDNGTWSVSNIVEPYITGDLGRSISFLAGKGASVERLAPDLFFQSYVKDKAVHFPHEHIGYAFHPYRFNYETLWNHVSVPVATGGGPPVQKGLTAGKIFRNELSGSWLSGRIRLHLHNHRRSWGIGMENLTLSDNARRFPGIDLIIEPASWLRYSFLTGSLFAYANQSENYLQGRYGYDLGDVQKLFSLHILELAVTEKFQLSASGGSIWSKRFEMSYLMPFSFPLFSQIETGDHDNLFLGIDLALILPAAGKTWFSLFIDEFSILDDGPLLRLPRNRYAWQTGWSGRFFRGVIPSTYLNFTYTRLTPFVYTHYPESKFNTFTSRPLDMTYTHDEFNLGYYLPPNSGEFKLKMTNLAVPDLLLCFDNRFIIHGTNDLSGPVNQIYGDIYRHQYGTISEYPLMDFTRDGIYDYTWMTELSFEKRFRWFSFMEYFTLKGSAGYSHTRWEINQSGVTAPKPQNLFTAGLGIVVDL